MLVQPVIEKEIEDALQGIGNNKALGADGFNAKFFKARWAIVKEEQLLWISLTIIGCMQL